MLGRMHALSLEGPDMPHHDDDRPVVMRDLRHTEQVLRGEMRTLMAELRGELRAEMHELFGNQTRTVLLGQLASSITLAALLIAA